MPKLMLNDVDVQGKRVLVRVDFNVPIEDGYVVSDKRLRAAVPTISYLLEHGSRVILISHLGRPSGKRINNLSLRPCAERLSSLINKTVLFLDNCVGEEVEAAVNSLKDGQVILLENLRFYKQEAQNNKAFAKKLSKLGDLYVNDAFGMAHRAHASTEGITHFLDCCVMGFLIEKELSCIGNALKYPNHVFVAVLGGSKISDKLSAICSLLPKVDKLILGGGMAYTFIKAMGFEIGESLFEPDKVSFAAELIEEFRSKLLLPIDCLITDSLDIDTRTIGVTKHVIVDSIERGWYGIDIGVKTILKFTNILRSAGTVVWNGPLGIFEIEEASVGTLSIAGAIGDATRNGAITIVGGGDSAVAVEKAKVVDKISHLSTGGGAALRFIEGKALPGIAALTDSY